MIARGWDYKEVMSLSLHELVMITRNIQDTESHRDIWEVGRMIVSAICNLFCKKKKTAHELLPLPWDPENAGNGEITSKRIQETKEIMEKYQKMLDEKKKMEDEKINRAPAE